MEPYPYPYLRESAFVPAKAPDRFSEPELLSTFLQKLWLAVGRGGWGYFGACCLDIRTLTLFFQGSRKQPRGRGMVFSLSPAKTPGQASKDDEEDEPEPERWPTPSSPSAFWISLQQSAAKRIPLGSLQDKPLVDYLGRVHA